MEAVWSHLAPRQSQGILSRPLEYKGHQTGQYFFLVSLARDLAEVTFTWILCFSSHTIMISSYLTLFRWRNRGNLAHLYVLFLKHDKGLEVLEAFDAWIISEPVLQFNQTLCESISCRRRGRITICVILKLFQILRISKNTLEVVLLLLDWLQAILLSLLEPLTELSTEVLTEKRQLS